MLKTRQEWLWHTSSAAKMRPQELEEGQEMLHDNEAVVQQHDALALSPLLDANTSPSTCRQSYLSNNGIFPGQS